MNKLKVFIPSLNRAAQLRLLLESLKRNFVDFNNLDFHILYSAYHKDINQYIKFDDGYDKLMRDYTFKSKSDLFLDINNITFEREADFCTQTKNFLYNNLDDYVLFFVDDIIFHEPYHYPVSHILSLLTDDVYTFSLRLGLNCTEQYYITGEMQPGLEKYGFKNLNDGNHIKWNWKIGPPQYSYFYPFSWDGHVYRVRDIYEVVKDKTFANPREFESIMVQPEVRLSNPRKNIVSDWYSHCFSNPVNCTQNTKIPAGTIHNQSAEYINDMYLQGYVLDLDSMDLSNIIGTHTERQLKFVRREKSELVAMNGK